MASVAAVTLLTLGTGVATTGALPGGATGTGGWLADLVRAASTYPAAPAGSTPGGNVPAGSSLSLAVVLSPPDPSALAAAATAVSTPGSPQYGQYLAPGQFAARYGPSPATVAAVDTWLAQDGFTPQPAVDDMLVPFTAPAGAAEQAFGVGLALERLPTGVEARVPSAAPLVPSSLTGAVAGISGLDTVAQPASHLVWPDDDAPGFPAEQADAAAGATATGGGATARAVANQAGPSACAGATAATLSQGGYTDSQLAGAYQFSGLYADGQLGQGVTVAAVELESFLPSDVAAFEACFGIGTSVTPVPVDGGASGPPEGTGEAAVDLEEVAALAPDAAVLAYEAPSSLTGLGEDYSTIVGQDRAQVITTSWGACESQVTGADLTIETTAFEQATLQGQTVVAASGDEGAQDCFAPGYNDSVQPDVDDPGSQPWVTSVGGTSLTAVTATGRAATQTTWNDCQGVLSDNGRPTPCALVPDHHASGGGLSAVWAMPDYQTAAGLPGVLPGDTGRHCADAAGTLGAPSGVCRAVPDVSGDADPATGVTVYFAGEWKVLGGTSIAAPQWAALVALADSGCSLGNQVGELNAKLYPLAAGPAGASVLTDITTGDNDFTGTNGGQFAAGPGFDLATGWGTPVADALVGALQPAGGCPVVDGLSASSGLARGGDPASLTITGADLAGATAVHFGAVAAPAFTVAPDGTSITVTPPAAGSGLVAVTVTTAGGTSGVTPAAAFDYIGPVVTAVSPSSGPPAGGRTVTISGSDFEPGGSGAGTTVQFGTVAATDVTVLSANAITAVVPAQPSGVVDVVVTDPDGASGTGPADQYTYTGDGYRLVASDGGVFTFGDAGYFGSTGGMTLDQPMVGMADTPDGAGYWLVASDGGIFAFGDAGFYGSTGGVPLAEPIVGMAATPDGGGYWLVASDGGVFAFGDAGFFGSLPGLPPGERSPLPVVAIVPTADGGGYWEVNSGGDVYSFGDAGFYGSTGAMTLSRPIVGMAATPDGGGYWLVASDGGIFAFGDAGFYGSTGGVPLAEPIVGMAATDDGGGYWLVASDGGVFAFGDAGFYGSTGAMTLTRPVVGMAGG